MTTSARIEGDGMVFVYRFSVKDRFDRTFAQPVLIRVLIRFGQIVMAILAHVEIQPRLIMYILRTSAVPSGMESDQMVVAVSGDEPLRHLTDDFLVPISVWGAVSAENPNDFSVTVAPREPFPVGARILRCEDDISFIVPIASPGRQHRNVEAQGQQDDRKDFFIITNIKKLDNQ